jgi:hypothetical protein
MEKRSTRGTRNSRRVCPASSRSDPDATRRANSDADADADPDADPDTDTDTGPNYDG